MIGVAGYEAAMLAVIASGHADLADVLFLLASFAAAIAAVIYFVRGAIEAGLVATSLALSSFAWLML